MNSSAVASGRSGRSWWLAAGLLTLLAPVVSCSDDSSRSPEPTGVSIAPPSAPPSTQAPSPSATGSAASSTDAPSSASGDEVSTAAAAVAVAEGAVADSTVVALSEDDTGPLGWEVSVRAGDNGRELRIDGSDGSVLSNQSDRLDQSQQGDLPKVSVLDAIEIAEKTVPDGVVTDAELSRDNGQQVWDVSVDVGGGSDWELWIDASSGEVVRQERD